MKRLGPGAYTYTIVSRVVTLILYYQIRISFPPLVQGAFVVTCTSTGKENSLNGDSSIQTKVFPPWAPSHPSERVVFCVVARKILNGDSSILTNVLPPWTPLYRSERVDCFRSCSFPSAKV